MPVETDYIGRGESGLVIKGELEGVAVALKVLYKSRDNVVSCLTGRCYKAVVDVYINRTFIVKHLRGGS